MSCMVNEVLGIDNHTDYRFFSTYIIVTVTVMHLRNTQDFRFQIDFFPSIFSTTLKAHNLS